MVFTEDAFYSGLGGARIQTKVFAVFQHRPRQPRIFRGYGDHRFPVAASFLQAACPAAEAILFVAQPGQNGARAHDEEAAQAGVARLGDAA